MNPQKSYEQSAVRIFVTEIAFDAGRARVALHFDRNHFPRFGKFADTPGSIVGNGHERAVEQHHRIASSVDFVVHFESVDRRVTRSWLLLRRYDSRHEHRQEKSCCLHVSFLAWASVPSSKSNDAPRNRRL